MTDERTPNVPLLRKYVEWVEAEEAKTEGREWWQEGFVCERMVDSEPYCQTTFCIAGKVAVDAGWRFEVDGLSVTNGVEHRSVDDLAAELLGLDGADQKWSLFNGENTAADVRRIAESIAGERL